MALAEALESHGGTHGADRCELYRLFGEPVRLRLLALAAEEELAVGELAELLDEAQPNVSRHAAPLRQRGLVVVRKQGTRALIRLADGAERDAVVADALATGRALCRDDGSLAKIPQILRARDVATRAYFAGASAHDPDDAWTALPAGFARHVAVLAPLIGNRALAVDAGTGDGGLLEVLSPVFSRVIAFDREAAQLTRCRARIQARALSNVEVVEGALGSAPVRRAVEKLGGADVVFAARLLHHAPKPAEAVRHLGELARPGGAIVVLDYARHDDEAMRAHADLWLGFEPKELRDFARAAGLESIEIVSAPTSTERGKATDAHLAWQLLYARKSQQITHETTKHRKRTS